MGGEKLATLEPYIEAARITPAWAGKSTVLDWTYF